MFIDLYSAYCTICRELVVPLLTVDRDIYGMWESLDVPLIFTPAIEKIMREPELTHLHGASGHQRAPRRPLRLIQRWPQDTQPVVCGQGAAGGAAGCAWENRHFL